MKYLKETKIIISVLILVLVSVGALIFFNNRNIIDNTAETVGEINIGKSLLPHKYNQPVNISNLGYKLSFIPLGAEASEFDREINKNNNNVFKYINTYKNTDVVMTITTDKLKEDIILKQPGHPLEFQYEINLNEFEWEQDARGNINIFVDSESERLQIGEVNNSHISATNLIDDPERLPIYTIPAPFMIDAQGNRSATSEVETDIIDNKLTLTINPDWLTTHSYPIILDPTVEFVEPEQENIEFGDASTPDFKPSVKMHRWDDETYIELEYITAEVGDAYIENDKIIWDTDGSVDVEMYPRDPEVKQVTTNDKTHEVTFNENGGIEFDLVLEEKPVSNVFTYRLRSPGLNFGYQPPLSENEVPQATSCTATQCYDETGRVIAYRPEEVVGSYAVYHEKKRGDYSQIGGKNYRTGKVFHIYRPRVWDAAGNEIWGDLLIDKTNELLTVTVAQEFLDTAVYPVTIDPNLGYTAAGHTTQDINANTAVCENDYTGTDGGSSYATSIYFYVYKTEGVGTNYYKGFIVNNDAGKTILSGSIGNPVGFSDYEAPAWKQSVIPSKPDGFSASTPYFICGVVNDTTTSYYDLDAAYGSVSDVNNYSSPVDLGLVFGVNKDFSIYATYTLIPVSTKIYGATLEINGTAELR